MLAAPSWEPWRLELPCGGHDGPRSQQRWPVIDAPTATARNIAGALPRRTVAAAQPRRTSGPPRLQQVGRGSQHPAGGSLPRSSSRGRILYRGRCLWKKTTNGGDDKGEKHTRVKRRRRPHKDTDQLEEPKIKNYRGLQRRRPFNVLDLVTGQADHTTHSFIGPRTIRHQSNPVSPSQPSSSSSSRPRASRQFRSPRPPFSNSLLSPDAHLFSLSLLLAPLLPVGACACVCYPVGCRLSGRDIGSLARVSRRRCSTECPADRQRYRCKCIRAQDFVVVVRGQAGATGAMHQIIPDSRCDAKF